MSLSPPYTGSCFCASTRYRIAAEPLTVYACHCTDRQKRSGSAFGLSMWVERAAIEVITGETALQVLKGPDGRSRPGRMCSRCGARLRVRMCATGSAQPWFAFPEGVPTYATQPDDFVELTRLWQSGHA